MGKKGDESLAKREKKQLKEKIKANLKVKSNITQHLSEEQSGSAKKEQLPQANGDMWKRHKATEELKKENTERKERDQDERDLKHLEAAKRLQTKNEGSLKMREATGTLKENENDGGWKEREAMEELQKMGAEGAGRERCDDAKGLEQLQAAELLETKNRSSLKENEKDGGWKEWEGKGDDGWNQCKDLSWECDDEWEDEEGERVLQTLRPKSLWRPRSNSGGRNKRGRSSRTKPPENAAAKPVMELRRGSSVVTSRMDVIPQSSATDLSQFELKAVQRTGTTLGAGAYGTVLLLKYKGAVRI